MSNPYYIELGGAGLQSARFLIEQNIDVLITKKIGNNPLRFIISSNIKIYLSSIDNVSEVIKLFYKGKLKEIKNRNCNFLKKREKIIYFYKNWELM